MSKIEKTKLKQKGEKKIIVTIFKILAFIIIVALQLLIMTALYTAGRGLYQYLRIIYDIIKIAMVLHLLYRHYTAAYKVSWILFILFMPVVGILAYFLWGNSKFRSKKEKIFRKIRVDTQELLHDSKNINLEILNDDKYKYNQIEYTTKVTGYPIYKNQGIEYFKIGENFFDSMLEDLKKAKHYILIEFYILASGKLLDKTLEILTKKASEGVKVQIIIDSLGCMLRKPKHFIEDMEGLGIEVLEFNPPTAIISSYLNYRDHRKIVVIDGYMAYTGGVNIADEYANIIEKFGHWKDVGIKVIGKSAWSYTLMFLRNVEEIKVKEVDYLWHKEISDKLCSKIEEKQGYVLPFADGPDNRKNPTESIYIQTINYAKDYVYITTPYFVISESLLNALLDSARSGVDVRVILPHIPDKKLIQIVTRSYYDVLLEAGVKVYEYKPGFIHSKTFVADDNTSIVGTANLDFRSMHLNFECVNYSYKTGEELKIKEDFEEMLNECIQIDIDVWKQKSIFRKIQEAVLSAFAPML